MCFHNSMTKSAIELAARYNKNYDRTVNSDIFEKYHINAFTRPECPVITTDEDIQIFRWGLIPHWIKNMEEADKISQFTFNAKSETIFEKPSFKNVISTKRCLIPSTGFFEWRHDKTNKLPYFIRLENEDIFSFAGIYDDWVNKETGELFSTFSIITTTANPLMEYIHNTQKRMPVIIPKNMEMHWLSQNLSNQQIQSFFKPFDEKDMKAYEINGFLSKNPHDSSIIEPKQI